MSANDVYDMTVKMFRPQAEPVFENPDELRASWRRQWGCNNDVGQLRAVMMHRPGPELDVIDKTKRIESIGSFGDNGLAVRPGRVIMPRGLSERTRETLDRNDIEVIELPYDNMHRNGGGIHCRTGSLVRDSID